MTTILRSGLEGTALAHSIATRCGRMPVEEVIV